MPKQDERQAFLEKLHRERHGLQKPEDIDKLVELMGEDLSDYVKQEDIQSLVTRQYVDNKFEQVIQYDPQQVIYDIPNAPHTSYTDPSNGLTLNYVSWGWMFMFWFSGELNKDFNFDYFATQFDHNTLPILSFYQGPVTWYTGRIQKASGGMADFDFQVNPFAQNAVATAVYNCRNGDGTQYHPQEGDKFFCTIPLLLMPE